MKLKLALVLAAVSFSMAPAVQAADWASAQNLIPARVRSTAVQALEQGRSFPHTWNRGAGASLLVSVPGMHPCTGSVTDNPTGNCQPVEQLTPVFQDMIIYRLINAHVQTVAGMFMDYLHFGPLFSGLMNSAHIEHDGSSSQPVTYDVTYDVPIRFLSINLSNVHYTLRNLWARDGEHFVNSWTFWRSAEGVHFVEGRATFVPVTMPDNSEKTLVMYRNYINPVDESSLVNRGYRLILDSDLARRQNVTQITAIVNRLADRAAQVEQNATQRTAARQFACSRLTCN